MPQFSPWLGSQTTYNPLRSPLEKFSHKVKNTAQKTYSLYNEYIGPKDKEVNRRKFYEGDISTKNYLANNYMAYTRRPNRRYRKRKRIQKRKTKLSRYVPLGIPKQKLVRFKLASPMLPAAGASTATAYYICKANSLNDPTGSAGAVLPLYLDQWAALYSKYVVVGSKIRVTLHSVTSTGGGVVGITKAKSGYTQTAYDGYLEMPHTTFRMLSSDVDIAQMKSSFSSKKFLKYKSHKDNDRVHGAFSTTPGSPTDEVDYIVWYQDANKTDNITLEGIIEMEFICLLFDPITPTRSSL